MYQLSYHTTSIKISCDIKVRPRTSHKNVKNVPSRSSVQWWAKLLTKTLFQVNKNQKQPSERFLKNFTTFLVKYLWRSSLFWVFFVKLNIAGLKLYQNMNKPRMFSIYSVEHLWTAVSDKILFCDYFDKTDFVTVFRPPDSAYDLCVNKCSMSTKWN